MNEFFLLNFRILCFFLHLKPKPLPLFVGFQKCHFFSETAWVKKPAIKNGRTSALQGDAHFHVASRVGHRQSSLGNAEHYHPFVPWLEKWCWIWISQDRRSSSGFPRNVTKAFFFWWFLDLGFDGWKSRILTAMIFFGGSKKGKIFVRGVFWGRVYSSDDLSDWFLRWAGTTDLNSGTRGGLLVVRYFGTGRSGGCLAVVRQTSRCAADFISKLFQKRSRFFPREKILYFSVSFKTCLAIFDLTGMFGPFFFSGDNLWRTLLEDTCASTNYDTCGSQPKTEEWHPSYRAVSIIDRFWWCWMFTASWLQ